MVTLLVGKGVVLISNLWNHINICSYKLVVGKSFDIISIKKNLYFNDDPKHVTQKFISLPPNSVYFPLNHPSFQI
jgi:hypothetical protein